MRARQDNGRRLIPFGLHYMPERTHYRGRIDPHKPILPDRKGNRHANGPMLGPNAAAGDPFTGELSAVSGRLIGVSRRSYRSGSVSVEIRRISSSVRTLKKR